MHRVARPTYLESASCGNCSVGSGSGSVAANATAIAASSATATANAAATGAAIAAVAAASSRALSPSPAVASPAAGGAAASPAAVSELGRATAMLLGMLNHSMARRDQKPPMTHVATPATGAAPSRGIAPRGIAPARGATPATDAHAPPTAIRLPRPPPVAAGRAPTTPEQQERGRQILRSALAARAAEDETLRSALRAWRQPHATPSVAQTQLLAQTLAAIRDRAARVAQGQGEPPQNPAPPPP